MYGRCWSRIDRRINLSSDNLKIFADDLIVFQDHGYFDYLFSHVLLMRINYLLSSSSAFYRLLIIFAISLDPDQARQIGPDLDPNCLTH